MRNTSRLLTILLLGMLGVCCRRLIPATRPPFTITGIVESVDPHGLSLRHKTGQRVSIAVTPQTTVVRRNSPAGVGDVKVGMRIVVLYHFVDGTPTADEVRLFRDVKRAEAIDPVLRDHDLRSVPRERRGVVAPAETESPAGGATI